MEDLRNPEASERLASEAPDEFLRRREFLQRTALTAGLATSFAGALSGDTLVAEAAKRQARVPLPSPRNMPIDTIVVLMMENRSFDHYLGWLPGADGRQGGLRYKRPDGKFEETRRLTPDYQGCGHPDPGHGWNSGRRQFNGGRIDGFLARGSGNDGFAVGYYEEGDLPFIPFAAKEFTTYDRYFTSVMDSTYPNREYMHAAESYGTRGNAIPAATGGFPPNTIFDALAKKGIRGQEFFNDLPPGILWGPTGLARSSRIEDYYQRCINGQLPPLSFVDPPFLNGGGGDGLSADEHPHGDVRLGQAFISDVVHAFMESPHWPRGALFITYDEWGGFFDHVRPPRVPDIRNSRNLEFDYGLMGFRVPTIAISPWVRRGHVSHLQCGHESILKMIEYRFGLPPLNRRTRYAANIARSFDFESQPRLDLPSLPDPQRTSGPACSLRDVPIGQQSSERGLASEAARLREAAHEWLRRAARFRLQAVDTGDHFPGGLEGQSRLQGRRMKKLALLTIASMLGLGAFGAAVEAKQSRRKLGQGSPRGHELGRPPLRP